MHAGLPGDPNDDEDESVEEWTQRKHSMETDDEPDDGRIEIIDAEGGEYSTDQEVHEWRRETVIASLIGACPHCDGPVEAETVVAPGTVEEKLVCQDCGEKWLDVEL